MEIPTGFMLRIFMISNTYKTICYPKHINTQKRVFLKNSLDVYLLSEKWRFEIFTELKSHSQ